ncbi:MAG: glycine cleavage system aminomethyltransferase GcvT [Bacteroidia bacterium]|jgi:aminomethyltransferase
MKTTALKQKHLNLGAKMVSFAGYEMPLQYAGLLPEHHAVRTQAGMFDVSHMGEFYVSGPQAFDLIQFATSNDVGKLSPGKIQYSCLPNDEGGIVDDLLVYQLAEERYMLVVNASNIEKDWQRLSSLNADFGAHMENRSDSISLLAVQGPKATELLQTLTEVNLAEIPYYHFKIGSMAGISDVILSNTGYTGAGGFELYVANEDAEALWDAVMEAGQPFGLLPAGLGARDTLRLEMGFCLYGNDIDDTTSPLEAGLGWITKLDTDFVNSAYLKEQKSKGLNRKLVGFTMLDRGIPRQGYRIVDLKGNAIGEVRSGTQSPSLGKAIGMGYVQMEYTQPESQIFIEIRGKLLEAKVVKVPFN